MYVPACFTSPSWVAFSLLCRPWSHHGLGQSRLSLTFVQHGGDSAHRRSSVAPSSGGAQPFPTPLFWGLRDSQHPGYRQQTPPQPQTPGLRVWGLERSLGHRDHFSPCGSNHCSGPQVGMCPGNAWAPGKPSRGSWVPAGGYPVWIRDTEPPHHGCYTRPDPGLPPHPSAGTHR